MAKIKRKYNTTFGDRASNESWSQVDKLIIKFAEENPIVYDDQMECSGNRKEVQNAAWWSFSGVAGSARKSRYWKQRWQRIKDQYIKFMTVGINKNLPFYSKYTDGRLVFLNRLIENQIEGRETKEYNTASEATNVSSLSSSLANYPNHDDMRDILAEQEKFDVYEKKVIDYARDHTLLYDTRTNLLVYQTSKIEDVMKLWTEFSVDFGKTGEDCHRTWIKLRRHYLRVRKVKQIDKNNPDLFIPAVAKYVDGKFGFLDNVYNYLKGKGFMLSGDEPDHIQMEHILNSGSLSKPVPSIFPNTEDTKRSFSDLELKLIDMVKLWPILYDIDYIKKYYAYPKDYMQAFSEYWADIAGKLKTNNKDCFNHWEEIRHEYLHYRSKISNNHIEREEFFEDKYKCLSFLDTKVCIASHIIITANAEDNDEKTDASLKSKTKSKSLRLQNEPEPSTSYMNYETTMSSSDNNKVSKDADISEAQSTIEERTNQFEVVPLATAIIKLEDEQEYVCETEPTVTLSCHELSTLYFFKEVGKYVASSFSEQKQENIRLKSWNMIKEMEKDPLQET